MLPLIRRTVIRKRIAESLASHLQMFNTHPYLTAPVIGSVVRIEEEGDTRRRMHLKKALMGPYAAIGDSFFWGALRSIFRRRRRDPCFSRDFCWRRWPFCFSIIRPMSGSGERDFSKVTVGGKTGSILSGGWIFRRVAGRIRLLSLILIGVLAAVAAEMACRPWTSCPKFR